MPGLLIPVIAVLVIAIGAVAIYASRETRAEYKRTGKHPKGHYMGQGIGIGMAVGVAIGLSMDTIAIGIPIGVAIGVAIGTSMEKKHAHELRPLTEKEMKMKRQAITMGIGLLIVTMLIAVGVFFLQ